MWEIELAFTNKLKPLLKRIEEKQNAIANLRPLPISAIDRLKKELALEWTYNSNSIEGNTLSMHETRVVLEEGITIGGKSLREHFETLNHHKAIDYLESLVSPTYELRSIDVLKLHEIILHNIDDDYAGRIRNGAVRIAGANFSPPNPRKVSDYLYGLIDYVNTNPQGLSEIILSTVFHHRLVWIHPFFDGNGRTARLAMNLILMKKGLPPAIILKNDRKKYYTALNQANNGNYAKLSLMMIQALEKSLNIYLQLAPSSYLEYESIANIANEPSIPYGMEYISLLARRGEIDAQKEGRNWYTTKEAVLNYYSKKRKKSD